MQMMVTLKQSLNIPPLDVEDISRHSCPAAVPLPYRCSTAIFFLSQLKSSHLLPFYKLNAGGVVIDFNRALSHLHSRHIKRIPSHLQPNIGLPNQPSFSADISLTSAHTADSVFRLLLGSAARCQCTLSRPVYRCRTRTSR